MIRKLHCTYAQFICISMASSSWLPVMNGAFAGDVHICGTVASIVSSCTACTLSVLCTWPMCVQMCSSMEVLHQPLGCGVQDFITARNNVRGCGCAQVCTCCTELLNDATWARCAKPGASVHSAIHSCACQSVALCGPSYTVIHV